MLLAVSTLFFNIQAQTEGVLPTTVTALEKKRSGFYKWTSCADCIPWLPHSSLTYSRGKNQTSACIKRFTLKKNLKVTSLISNSLHPTPQIYQKPPAQDRSRPCLSSASTICQHLLSCSRDFPNTAAGVPQSCTWTGMLGFKSAPNNLTGTTSARAPHTAPVALSTTSNHPSTQCWTLTTHLSGQTLQILHALQRKAQDPELQARLGTVTGSGVPALSFPCPCSGTTASPWWILNVPQARISIFCLPSCVP